MDDWLYAVERAAIAEEVASVLRHDIRNKLLAVRNASFYLKRRMETTDLWKTDARARSFYELIDEELNGASSILEERAMLKALFNQRSALFRLSTGAVRGLEARAIPAGIRVESDFDEADAVVADPIEIALAARCLIDNAAEATPESGTIYLKTIRRGTVIALVIIDEGPGLPADLLAGGARPFATSKPGHAGLGLCIAQRIAGRYGGRLTLSSPGRGSVVTLELPAASAEPAESAASNP